MLSAVGVDSNVKARGEQYQFIKRNLAAPERIDLQTHLNGIGAKERLGIFWFKTVDYHAAESGMQGKPGDGHAADFGFSAGKGIDTTNQGATKKSIAQAAINENYNPEEHQGNAECKEPDKAAQPPDFFRGGFLRHLGQSVKNRSTCKRMRDSLSHCSVCSLMACCIKIS